MGWKMNWEELVCYCRWCCKGLAFIYLFIFKI
jgi:hypothetical protein